MAAIPIWKDKIVDLGTSSTYFRIRAGADTIYQGKAVARPGESNAKVRVNDICSDYLGNALPTITDRTYTAITLPTFYLEKSSNGLSWTSVQTINFYPDWSYDYGFTGSNLSFPINGRVDSRMFILSTVLEKSSPLNAYYYNSSGTSTTRSATISPSPGTGTAAFKADAVAGTVRISINGSDHYVVTDCARYALYYVNAYGGWDQFLIEGNDLEVDSLERFIREQEYDNTNIRNAGKVNYVNDITKTWTFNSGWLKDEQASRMHHLLDSCLVYLCDISTGTFIPVIVTTDVCDYKTRKNQGGRVVNYTFNVELAQNRIRR